MRLCDNSNLSHRSRPTHGILEKDGLHVPRQGVFALNKRFRSCVYKSSSESGQRRFQSRGNNYRRFGGRRMIGGCNAGFCNNHSQC